MNKIGGLQYKDGRVMREEAEMEIIARRYFQSLFTTKGTGEIDYILTGVGKCISNEANVVLTEKFTQRERFFRR